MVAGPYYLTVGAAADLLQVHPRTVVRRLTGEANPPWESVVARGELISLCALALAFDSSIFLLERVVDGRDRIMKTRDMARYLGLPLETFKYREYPDITHSHRLVRYSLRDTARAHVDYYQ